MRAHFTTPHVNGLHWGVTISQIGHKLTADMQPEGSVGGETVRNRPGPVARRGRALANMQPEIPPSRSRCEESARSGARMKQGLRNRISSSVHLRRNVEHYRNT